MEREMDHITKTPAPVVIVLRVFCVVALITGLVEFSSPIEKWSVSTVGEIEDNAGDNASWLMLHPPALPKRALWDNLSVPVGFDVSAGQTLQAGFRARWRSLTTKLRQGKQVRVLVIGGSNTKNVGGSSSRADYRKDFLFHNLLRIWLDVHFPAPELHSFEVVAAGGASSCYWVQNRWLEITPAIKAGVDLVIVDVIMNNDVCERVRKRDPSYNCTVCNEILLDEVWKLDSSPSVIFLDFRPIPLKQGFKHLVAPPPLRPEDARFVKQYEVDTISPYQMVWSNRGLLETTKLTEDWMSRDNLHLGWRSHHVTAAAVASMMMQAVEEQKDDDKHASATVSVLTHPDPVDVPIQYDAQLTLDVQSQLFLKGSRSPSCPEVSNWTLCTSPWLVVCKPQGWGFDNQAWSDKSKVSPCNLSFTLPGLQGNHSIGFTTLNSYENFGIFGVSVTGSGFDMHFSVNCSHDLHASIPVLTILPKPVSEFRAVFDGPLHLTFYPLHTSSKFNLISISVFVEQ